MDIGALRRLPPRWQARVMKLGFNTLPAFRATGGRVVHVTPELDHIRVCLPLNRRTRNRVGTLYGGALFAITDGPHFAMLLAALGGEAVVWDKAATIRYRRPGHGTVFADCRLPAGELADIRQTLARSGETERTYTIDITGSDGTVHAQVERTLYIADKAHYRRRQEARRAPAPQPQP